jgi:hypothetical protein
MIKFFRKIRYNLMEQNKTGKYFKYAIGEIVLVVLGILIALQINNWNENNKKRSEEITILENIKQDISFDQADVDYNIKYHFLYLKEERKLLAYLQKAPIPLDSINLNDALGVPLILALHESTFNNLQNNEVGILRNNTLRKKIARLYDFFATAAKKMEDKNSIAYDTYSKKLPYFLKHTSLSTITKDVYEFPDYEDYLYIEYSRNSFVLSNADEAKKDEAFKIILSECSFFREVTLEFYNNLKTKMTELIIEIDKELQELKN